MFEEIEEKVKTFALLSPEIEGGALSADDLKFKDSFGRGCFDVGKRRHSFETTVEQGGYQYLGAGRSYIVINISPGEAKDFADLYDQDSFIFADFREPAAEKRNNGAARIYCYESGMDTGFGAPFDLKEESDCDVSDILEALDDRYENIWKIKDHRLLNDLLDDKLKGFGAYRARHNVYEK